MKFSNEIETLKPYKPGKPIAETQREFGLKEVVKLASNENPIGASKQVVSAIEKAALEIHRYPDASCYELKHAMAGYYGVSTEMMTFGNGSNELIDLLIRLYCDPRKDKVLTSKGAFIAYKICSQVSRVETLEIPLSENLRFDLLALAKKLEADSGSIRLVFIANPNNPTGTYVNESELIEFLDIAQKYENTLIVLDEAYNEFVRAKDYPQSLDLMKKYKNVASLRTLSKVYGIAGLRLGVLIAQPEVIGFIDRIRNPFNVNLLAQEAAKAAVADREYLKKSQQVNWEGLDYFYKEFSQMGLKYWESQGNFVLIDCERDSEEINLELLKLGLIVRPVKGYGLATHLRVSVGLPEENKFAVEAIKQVLKG